MSEPERSRIETEPSKPRTRVGTLLVQRKCACGGTPGPDGECAACRAKRLGLQRKAASAAAAFAPPIVHQVINSPGQPLESEVRAAMEPRFGHDFGRVRVHTDAQAAASARAVSAVAYTVGHKVVFGAGRYNPGTPEGQRLLAHELTHVVQQRDAGPADTLAIAPPDDSREHAAEQAGQDSWAGPRETRAMARPVLQRAPEDGSTPATAPAAPAPATPYEAPDPQRFNFVFIMGTADDYKSLGEWFAKTYYSSTHEIVRAPSLCSALMTLQDRLVSAGFSSPRDKLGQVIIITHADKDGHFFFPLQDGDQKKWVTADDIVRAMSPNQSGAMASSCQAATFTLGYEADAASHVIVKGCNLGQNQKAVEALRTLFGGQATVTAPKYKQGFETVGYGAGYPGRRTPTDVITWMVRNGYLPPEAEQWPDDKKTSFVTDLFDSNAQASGIFGIPAEYLRIGNVEVPPSDPRFQQGQAVSPSPSPPAP